jgi:anti-sigma regulatory factor (Ser/Thr protein kinase)
VTAYPSARSVARLTVTAEPEALALCRHALAGALNALALEEDAVDDLKLVLSEVCKNAIEHGYVGGAGVIEIEFRISPGEFETAVRDHGRGVPADARRGTGWAALEMLTSRHTVQAGESDGTLVTFAVSL